MKVEIRSLSSVFADLDYGNVCPACPKVKYFIAVASSLLVFAIPALLSTLCILVKQLTLDQILT